MLLCKYIILFNIYIIKVKSFCNMYNVYTSSNSLLVQDGGESPDGAGVEVGG